MKSLLKSVVGFVSLGCIGLAYSSDELIFKEGLPMMVDSNTELSEIMLKNMTVIYSYNLKNISLKDALSARDDHISNVEETACEDEDIHELFNKDLAVKFIYKIQDKKFIEVCVNKDFCRQLNNRLDSENPYDNQKTYFNHLSYAKV
jgi:hypothetical protein